MNKVFRFSYPNDNLPDGRDAIMNWAGQETERLTGGHGGKTLHYIEENAREPEHRLTISVPESEAEALAALQARGTTAEFEEPEAPYAEDNQIVLPGTFQALKLGGWLHPRAIQDNPMRLTMLCLEIRKAVPDLPAEAGDWENWLYTEHDEDDGTFIITWGTRAPETL